MASTDARPIPQKNVAYRVTFPIFDADGDLVTGATGLDSEVSKDGGTFADCTNEATEIATNSGMYYLDLTSTEMNADTVAVIVKTSSSGAKTTPIVMYPEETGDLRVNVTAYGGTAGTFASGRPEVNTTHIAGTSQTAGDIIADTNDIQSRLPAALVSGRIDASVGAMATDVLTSTALAASAVTEIQTGLSTLDAAGVRSAVGLASANLDTQLDAIPTANENADALLKRDWTAVTGEAARSALNALRFLRNKWSVAASTLTVTKEDDSTTAWTGAVTTDAAADPITGNDPS